MAFLSYRPMGVKRSLLECRLSLRPAFGDLGNLIRIPDGSPDIPFRAGFSVADVIDLNVRDVLSNQHGLARQGPQYGHKNKCGKHRSKVLISGSSWFTCNLIFVVIVGDSVNRAVAASKGPGSRIDPYCPCALEAS